MSVTLEFVDFRLINAIDNCIAELTDLSFSAYSDTGVLIIPCQKEDKIASRIKSYISGREEYERFISEGIKKASMRKDASMFRGIANQHHLFIPVSVNGLKLVLVSNPFYLARTEFEEFLIRKGRNFGFSSLQVELYQEEIKVKDYAYIDKVSAHIKTLFETLFRCDYEKNLNYKRYQWAKTITDVLFNIRLPMPEKEVHSLIVDALLFLFDLNTVSIMAKEKNFFKTGLSSGKLKEDVKHFCLKDAVPMVSRAIKDFIPASTNDIAELSGLGFPDSITSVHVFPLVFGKTEYGITAVYNSIISREEAYSIIEFCKLISLVLYNLSLHNAHDKYIDNQALLKEAVDKLMNRLHDPEALSESIVEVATEILRADKGSLMMPEAKDNNNNVLRIKAVKGINRYLIKDIKVTKGEGIAGRVFQDGKPMFSKDMAKDMAKDDKERWRNNSVSAIKLKSRYSTGSFISVPFKFASETIGVINVSDKITGEEFTESDLALLVSFADYASIALKTSDYYSLAEQMKELSIVDPLTGLYNKRYFYERFTEEIHRSERYEFVFSTAIFDIDDFKLFNDTEGHLAGDNVLKEMADIARRSLRSNDVIARFGGEEFIVLMPQTDNEKKEALIVVERMRKNIKESLTRKYEKFPRPSVTVSIGISSFPENGKSSEDLIKHADIALYRAKAAGKDRSVIYT